MNKTVMNTLPPHVYHFSGIKNGPTVVIIGAMHGDERVGAHVIKMLKEELITEKICGEIYLIIGNPKAYEKNVRFIDADLNRLFGEDFDQIAKKNIRHLTGEEKRALEIAPILAKADYLLDIHSTIKKSVPFIYIKNSPNHCALAQFFGTKFIVSPLSTCQGKTLYSSADNFVDKNNGTGITYEAGWHKDEAIFAHALSVTKQFLK